MARISTNPLVGVYRERYGFKTFVETGLFRGESVEDAVAMGFQEIYSCDLNPAYIESARERWPWGKFYVGESQHCLKDICDVNKEPSLFWLDAHLPLYHGMDEPSTVARCPLFEELQVLKKHKVDVHKDVIMCDDTNVITKNNPNAYTEQNVAPDQLIHFIDFQAMLDIFKDTHDVHQYPRVGHGVVCFEPK